jgi:hypothetical protein
MGNRGFYGRNPLRLVARDRTANLPDDRNGSGRPNSAPSLVVAGGIPENAGGTHGTGYCHTAGSLWARWCAVPARKVGERPRVLGRAGYLQVLGAEGVGGGSKRTHTAGAQTPWLASKRTRAGLTLSSLLRTICRVKPSLRGINDSRNSATPASDPPPRWRVRLALCMASGFVFLVCLSPAHR